LVIKESESFKHLKQALNQIQNSVHKSDGNIYLKDV